MYDIQKKNPIKIIHIQFYLLSSFFLISISKEKIFLFLLHFSLLNVCSSLQCPNHSSMVSTTPCVPPKKTGSNFDGRLMHPQSHVPQSSASFAAETGEQQRRLFHVQELASAPSPPCQNRTIFLPAKRRKTGEKQESKTGEKQESKTERKDEKEERSQVRVPIERKKNNNKQQQTTNNK